MSVLRFTPNHLYQSIIGVHLRSHTELGTSALNKIDYGIWQVRNDFGRDAEWQQLPMDATQQMSHYGQAYSQSETHGDTSPFVVHIEEFVMVSTHEILQLLQEFVPYCDSSSIISFKLWCCMLGDYVWIWIKSNLFWFIEGQTHWEHPFAGQMSLNLNARHRMFFV